MVESHFKPLSSLVTGTWVGSLALVVLLVMAATITVGTVTVSTVLFCTIEYGTRGRPVQNRSPVISQRSIKSPRSTGFSLYLSDNDSLWSPPVKTSMSMIVTYGSGIWQPVVRIVLLGVFQRAEDKPVFHENLGITIKYLSQTIFGNSPILRHGRIR